VDKYAYREYSSDYPRLFEIERDRLRRALEIPAQIEHIGSTAVVGLGGKGILDVGIGVACQDRSSAREQLSRAGYEYRAKASTASRDFFRADYCDGRDVTRVHIHLLVRSETEWTQLLRFRDYLRCHPTRMQEYADTKASAAREACGDGSKYIALKDAVLQKVLRLAMEGSNDERSL
jgi:GrpB-like predicted nucleotidyltransferase (UPF0157 family)